MPGTILLTFDDRGVSGWRRYAEVFAAHDARVSFYLSHADLFTSEQWREIDDLAAAGHEIGAHGHRHRKAPECIAETSVAEWLSAEIDPCVDELAAHGHPVTSFAYPHGRRDEVTDAALLERFAAIRATSPRTTDPAEAAAVLQPSPPPRVLASRGIDVGRAGAHNPDDREVLDALFAATAQRNGVICLYGHNFAEDADGLASGTNYTTPERLEEILASGERHGLRFRTVSSQYR